MSKTTKQNSFRYTEHLILAGIWLLVLLSPLFFYDGENTITFPKLINTWKKLLPFILLSLLNHFILVPYILFKRNKWMYLLAGLLTTIVFVTAAQTLKQNTVRKRPPARHQPRPPRMGEHMQPPPRPNGQPQDAPRSLPPHVNTLLLAILILGFDTGLRLAFRWTRLEKEREQLEKERVKSELAFLRNQVSPHFFMNTLNNIHSLIDFDTEEAKGSIIRLSKLMRHLLYESEAERIAIAKEMDFIRHYIDLMKLRYSEKVDITLHIDTDLPDAKIPPLLFTSYVENAFKHGVSYQHPSFIHISICINGNELEFSVRNSNHQNENQSEAGGIGAENARKRLDLLFGDKYILHEEGSDNEYIVQLKVPIT